MSDFCGFDSQDGVSADDELESYLLKGNRRVSYLMATATSPTIKIPHKLSDISNPEADDEDSDTFNVSCQNLVYLSSTLLVSDALK